METAQEWMAEIDAAAERFKRRESWKKLLKWLAKFSAVVVGTVAAAVAVGYGLAKVIQ